MQTVNLPKPFWVSVFALYFLLRISCISGSKDIEYGIIIQALAHCECRFFMLAVGGQGYYYSVLSEQKPAINRLQAMGVSLLG